MDHSQHVTSQVLLEAIYNHVALPPQLPISKEGNLETIELALIDRYLDAIRKIRDSSRDEAWKLWDRLRLTMQTCKTLHSNRLSEVSLLKEFKTLEIGQVLIVYVREQNAGLIIHRNEGISGEIVAFEAFEASPLSEYVITSESALIFTFPNCAVSIPAKEFDILSFQSELARFLAQANRESIKRFASYTSKAGVYVSESRDTVSPALITQLLFTIIEIKGFRAYPKLLSKRVRDEVSWSDGAENPWRRSAMWLILRASIQRCLYTCSGAEIGRVYYKYLGCIFLARLLEDSTTALHLDALHLLNAKLCRRLAKLETQKGRLSRDCRTACETLANNVEPYLLKIAQATSQHIQSVWDKFKSDNVRPIFRLRRNCDARDLILSLPNSGPYLRHIMACHHAPATIRRSTQDAAKVTKSKVDSFASQYFEIFDAEAGLEVYLTSIKLSDISKRDRERCCTEAAGKIQSYMSLAMPAYDHTEQRSTMILYIMRLWKVMDQAAGLLQNGLLHDYQTTIPVKALDVLHLSELRDMEHLLDVQSYLSQRASDATFNLSLFDAPCQGCFAERYYDRNPSLRELHEHIETRAQKARQRKEEELKQLTEQYRELTEKMEASSHLYIIDESISPMEMHDPTCRRCYLGRQIGRLKIQAYEHPLPADTATAKAVIFELKAPSWFTAYRQATWKILGSLARPKIDVAPAARVLLRDYAVLNEFRDEGNMSEVSLASTTKSWLMTHYAYTRLPVEADDVILPNGLRLSYHDSSTASWPGIQRQKPTLAHHCPLVLPKSPFQSAVLTSRFGAFGPSSSEAIASQTRVPKGVTVHEWISFQSLLGGEKRRWLQLLIELGSTNLNFGSSAINVVVSKLCLEAGSLAENNERKSLRACHQVFMDKSFCETMMLLLFGRLDKVTHNWREVEHVETILTIALRVVSLSENTKQTALAFVKKTRAIALGWIRELRKELTHASNLHSRRTIVSYALGASLLCRRTFTVNRAEDTLDNANLECFIQSTTALQESIGGDPTVLSPLVKHRLIRDLKLVHRLCPVIERSLRKYPSAVAAAVQHLWPNLPNQTPTLEFNRDGPWINAMFYQGRDFPAHSLSFHWVLGHVHINGEPIGRLPARWRNDPILIDLFDNQDLQTFPSNYPGMEWMLKLGDKGNQIHLGCRSDGKLFARTYGVGRGGVVMEYVPRTIFHRQSSTDLPSQLVDNVVHWLDLENSILHCREKPHIWHSKDCIWRIDLVERMGRRKDTFLVNPQSYISMNVNSILSGIEDAHHITIFQRQRNSVVVALPRLSLTWSVNRNGLLESPELRSEVDPFQCIGTFFGLFSKLTVRHAINHEIRSVLVPMGPIGYRRKGPHVEVTLERNGGYAKYEVNQILGRLECTPEPRLLFLATMCHAYTSFFLPDPLTGRTGTEEAIDWLRMGQAQPWSPFGDGPADYLHTIARLSPSREYYPPDMRRMEKVTWNRHLTTTIQSDLFSQLVSEILRKSDELAAFYQQKPRQCSAVIEDKTLVRRSVHRQYLYARPLDSVDAIIPYDSTYAARGQSYSSQARNNVYITASLVYNQASRMACTPDLAGILQSWATIGGFVATYPTRPLLNDLLALNMPENFGSLVATCRALASTDKHCVLFLLCTLSFKENVDMGVIRTLVAFSVYEELKQLVAPIWPSYRFFRINQIPRIDTLLLIIKSYQKPMTEDRQHIALQDITQLNKRSKKGKLIEVAYAQRVQDESKTLATELLAQWPCENLVKSRLSTFECIDTDQAMEAISLEWIRLFQNWSLWLWLENVQQILDKHRVDVENILTSSIAAVEQESFMILKESFRPPNLGNLLLRSCSKSWIQFSSSISNSSTGNHTIPMEHVNSSTETPAITELESIIRFFAKDSGSSIRSQYGEDLSASLDALRAFKPMAKPSTMQINKALISAEISKLRLHGNQKYLGICQHFERDDPRARWLSIAGIWPCTSKTTLLQRLSSTSDSKIGSIMKENMIKWAMSIERLQWLIRLHDALREHDRVKIELEISNEGHHFDPMEYPDWLLLELDTNITIRKGQVEMALEIISPTMKSNGVYQLNMGQGKTSVIIPMSILRLADRKQLTRVILPRSLLAQTAHVLQSRVGRLNNRELVHLPFTRQTSNHGHTIQTFFEIHKRILKSAGVILTIPEVLMSFRLSGLQRLSEARNEAIPMIKICQFLDQKCRDIIDESDHILSPMTQLIFPTGSRKHVDGSPHRWHVIEDVLQLVNSYLPSLEKMFSKSVKVVHRPGFPFIFILRQDFEDALIYHLVDDISSSRTDILKMADFNDTERASVKSFLSEPRPTPSQLALVECCFANKPIEKKLSYLLRGLFVHRILGLCLRKRWNVQYGLHPDRVPLAVPYHYRGCPSDTSEFGHIEVSLVLGVLSFYYKGLSVLELTQTVEHLLKSDDPSPIFERWTSNSSLPSALKNWDAINIDDEVQMLELWAFLRYDMAVINYHLNHFVFPHHAKTFSEKLQLSGWDIPLLSSNGGAQITGYSGTNDSRRLLPLTIEQRDIPALLHTNAEVLSLMLQPRNREFVTVADPSSNFSEHELLKNLKERNIWILIDAGAQILEMDNETLVLEWLKICTTAKAAVYFRSDKAWVAPRKGRPLPLLASPFADDLSQCLIFLDESKTRGVDLKGIPPHAAGALTLAMGQTKDHTVQAAMRLRQLSTTQSVVFFAPPEVEQHILDNRQRYNGTGPLDSFDVVHWLLRNTCNGIESLQPLCYHQGIDYIKRTHAAMEFSDFLDHKPHRENYVEALRRQEQKTLEKMYEVKSTTKLPQVSTSMSPRLATYMRTLNNMRRNFQDNGTAVAGSALHVVEQEREVAFEVEEVREPQKKLHYSALAFTGLHRDVLNFATKGRLAAGSGGYEAMVPSLRRTFIGRKYNVRSGASVSLYISTEFTRTISGAVGRCADQFMRPVSWILYSMVTNVAMIISPEEVELLLPILRDSIEHCTHLIAYSPPITRSMVHFNTLTFYAVPSLPAQWRCPSSLKIELLVFAGGLYCSYSEYVELHQYLGLRLAIVSVVKDDTTVGSVGERGEESRTELTNTSDGLCSSDVEAAESLSGDQVLQKEELAETGDDTDVKEIADERKLQGTPYVIPPSPTTFKRVQTSSSNPATKPGLIADNPLLFLQEYLAARRKTSDISSTPLGFLCSGKPLTADHYFFKSKQPEAEKAPRVPTRVKKPELEEDSDDSGSEDDEFHECDEFNDGEGFADGEFGTVHDPDWKAPEDVEALPVTRDQ